MIRTARFPGGRQIGRQAPFLFPSGYATDRLGSAFIAGNDWRTHPALSFAKGAGAGLSDPPDSDSVLTTPPGALSYPSGFKHSDAHIQYVNDTTFGTVVRGRYPYCTGGQFYHNKVYTFAGLNKAWARQVVEFEANQYTTRGTDPVGANSHKVAFLTWAGGVGNRLEIEFSNTNQYILGGAQTGRTFTETALSGGAAWGNVTTEWTGGEWWEYILNYEIRPTDTSREPAAIGTAIARLWGRRLTSGGVINPGAWLFQGWWWDFTVGSPAQVGGYQFFGNRNRSADLYPDGSARPELISGHDPFHVYYGPHEVVDGEQNNDPYGLQGTGE